MRFFFLGMMGLSALAEAAGLFDWLAVQAARLAGQSAARLFLNVFLLGSLVVIAINFGVFFFLYRKQLQGHFDVQRLPSSEETVPHQSYFRYTGGVLAAVAVAYVTAAALKFPLSIVAMGGKPSTGPKSVGHVARFVLDHSPCPVLLMRPLTQEHFRLPP